MRVGEPHGAVSGQASVATVHKRLQGEGTCAICVIESPTAHHSLNMIFPARLISLTHAHQSKEVSSPTSIHVVFVVCLMPFLAVLHVCSWLPDFNSKEE